MTTITDTAGKRQATTLDTTAEPAAASCCSRADRQACCAPSEKEDCCGRSDVAPASCGCHH